MLDARKSRPASVKELERQVLWYNSFLGSAFQHAEKIEFMRAQESVECLGWIGLAFLDAGFVEVALNSAQNIVSIAENCSSKMATALPNRLAELLMPIRLIKFLASHIDSQEFLARLPDVERRAAQKVAHWDQVVMALDHLEQEILEELDRRYQGIILDPNSPEGILIRILERRARGQAEQAAQPEQPRAEHAAENVPPAEEQVGPVKETDPPSPAQDEVPS